MKSRLIPSINVAMELISTTTVILFRTFVLAPCMVFLLVFFLAANSAGGIGNFITDYVKKVEYNAGDNSYRTCLDQPPTTADFHNNTVMIGVCENYGYISAEEKASHLNNTISNFYILIVAIYICIFLFVRVVAGK